MNNTFSPHILFKSKTRELVSLKLNLLLRLPITSFRNLHGRLSTHYFENYMFSPFFPTSFPFTSHPDLSTSSSISYGHDIRICIFIDYRYKFYSDCTGSDPILLLCKQIQALYFRLSPSLTKQFRYPT